MAGFRNPFDIQSTLEPWRHELGDSFDAVVAHMSDRDRALEDFLRLIDPAGRYMWFAGSLAPPGWLLCDGSAVSRVQYSALFTAIGTTYGAGDGTNTFNLPNVKGRVMEGQDAGQTEFATLGQTGGSKTSVASHTHGLNNHSHGGVTGTDSPDHAHSGTTGTMSSNHSHNVGGQVGTNVTAHTHGGATGQFSGQPSSGFFTGFVDTTDGASADHTHGFTSAGATARHSHGISGDNGVTGDASTVATSGNLTPYIVANCYIRY